MKTEKLAMISVKTHVATGDGISDIANTGPFTGFMIEPCAPFCGPLPVLVTVGDGASGQSFTLSDRRPIYLSRPATFLRLETLTPALEKYAGLFPPTADPSYAPGTGRSINGRYRVYLLDNEQFGAVSPTHAPAQSDRSTLVRVAKAFPVPTHEQFEAAIAGTGWSPRSHQFTESIYRPYYVTDINSALYPFNGNSGLSYPVDSNFWAWFRVQSIWDRLAYHFNCVTPTAAGDVNFYLLDFDGRVRLAESIPISDLINQTDATTFQAQRLIWRTVDAGNVFMTFSATSNNEANTTTGITLDVDAIILGSDI